VRLAGIEPTTPWFVAKYSIQLSYSREKQNYSSNSTQKESLQAVTIEFFSSNVVFIKRTSPPAPNSNVQEKTKSLSPQ
jgi:hypothetical protein